MIFTDEQIEAIKAAALPIDYGSLTIQIGATFPYLEIEANRILRIDKELEQKGKKN